jgi:hypothetical protein
MFDDGSTSRWIQGLSRTGRVCTCIATAIMLYVINSLIGSDKNHALTMTLGGALFTTIWLYEIALSGSRPDRS